MRAEWQIDRVADDPGSELMRKAVNLLLVVPLLIGCSPEAPSGDGSPTPSSPSLTSTSPTPSASPSMDPSQDPLYLEAVEVYKAYFAELTKAEMSGFKPKSLSPMIDPYVTGTMKTAVEAGYTTDRSSGLVFRGTSPARISQIGANPRASRNASVVSIRVCVDARHLEIIRRDDSTRVGQGVLAYKEVYFIRESGRLMAAVQDSKEVESCPIN
ncbi:hypothetical protein AAEX57_11365 [Luteococcus sp. H91]